jgi:hypothetical protein
MFAFADGVLSILNAPERSITELARLFQIMAAARAANAGPEQVAEQIEKEVPGLSGLTKCFPTGREQWYSFLSLIVAVLAFGLQINQSNSPPQPPSPPVVNVSQNVTVGQETVGRNDPCPCGSGKKFKKCCGKDQ